MPRTPHPYPYKDQAVPLASEAEDYVRRISRRIVLIDGRGLAKRMYDYGIGMRLTGRRQSKQLDEAYFDAED